MNRSLAAVALCATLLAVGRAGAQEEQAHQQGQLACTSIAKLTKFLADSYHETAASVGLRSDGQLIEVFVSPDGETWTAITTSPAGLACVIAAGKRWMDVKTEGAPA